MTTLSDQLKEMFDDIAFPESPAFDWENIDPADLHIHVNHGRRIELPDLSQPPLISEDKFDWNAKVTAGLLDDLSAAGTKEEKEEVLRKHFTRKD